MYVRFPLSLRNVEDLLHERGMDISYETVRFWWNRFGPLFAGEIRKKRVSQMRACSNWQWHLDEAFVNINGETHYLWRAVDRERGSPGELRHKVRRCCIDPAWFDSEGRCCMEHEGVGTRPTRDRFQAVRWKLGRPSSVIRLRIWTPILASVF
jgi:hypothetical protein